MKPSRTIAITLALAATLAFAAQSHAAAPPDTLQLTLEQAVQRAIAECRRSSKKKRAQDCGLTDRAASSFKATFEVGRG